VRGHGNKGVAGGASQEVHGWSSGGRAGEGLGLGELEKEKIILASTKGQGGGGAKEKSIIDEQREKVTKKGQPVCRLVVNTKGEEQRKTDDKAEKKAPHPLPREKGGHQKKGRYKGGQNGPYRI